MDAKLKANLNEAVEAALAHWKKTGGPRRKTVPHGSATVPYRTDIESEALTRWLIKMVRQRLSKHGHAETEMSGIVFQLRLSRRKRLMATMYSVCGDESHDAKKERVFAIGGLFGSQEDWDSAEAAWLIRTGGKVFHAADCESDHGEFAGIDHEENLSLYKDLTQILVKSKLCGRAVAIDLAGSRQHFPDILPESDYHKCFMELLLEFGELAYIAIPQGKVKFTFDHRFETDYSAAQLYKYATDQPEWRLYPCFHDEIAFATRRTVGIQMADLVAREAMKELDRLISGSRRDMRKSLKAMIANPYRFSFRFFTKEYFEDFKAKFADVEAAAGLDFKDFAQWLQQNGVTDNWTSRIRYAIEVEARERMEKLKAESEKAS